MTRSVALSLLAALGVLGAAGLNAQGRLAFVRSLDHAAINYFSAPLRDPVTTLNRKIQDGAARLTFQPGTGYLRAVLDALEVPIESQVAVFSHTSLQAERISPTNPRTVFFSDRVAVGWVPGGVIEVASQDPTQGVVFYRLEQQPVEQPQFERSTECLRCHITWETFAVPGLLVLTTFPMTDPSGYALGGVSDHRTPLAERWGGWYVTGDPGPNGNFGNIVPTGVPQTVREAAAPETPVRLDSLATRLDASRYLSPFSDVVALMVLEHQARMTNLLTFIGWEARVAASEAQLRHGRLAPAPPETSPRMREIAGEVVDYLLFVDEAPLAGRIRGTSGFAERFAATGPRDSRGRSLRQLDLERRLMRYPCSYMIYSDAFDALPDPAKAAIYERLWEILSGREADEPYRRLSLDDRRAIVEILRETKPGLPEYFRPPATIGSGL